MALSQTRSIQFPRRGFAPGWRHLGALLVGYEILGALRAVTPTDVSQGVVIFAGSLSVLAFVDTDFEGLPNVTSELERISPQHVQVVDASQGLSWAELWIGVGVQRALFSDSIQKAMAARSDNHTSIAGLTLRRGVTYWK